MGEYKAVDQESLSCVMMTIIILACIGDELQELYTESIACSSLIINVYRQRWQAKFAARNINIEGV